MEKNRIHALRFGDTTRMSYSKINEVLDMPNLIEVQKDSYQWFLKEGLKEVFEDISPITDFSGNLVLEFIDFTLDSEPKFSIEECKEREDVYKRQQKACFCCGRAGGCGGGGGGMRHLECAGKSG